MAKKNKPKKPAAAAKRPTPKPATKPFPWQLVLTVVYAAILIVAFLKIYNDVYEPKLDLNGDNFSYYMLGKSLAEGNGYVNVNTIAESPHGHFPPGYPAIVATVMTLFGDDVDTIKTANGVLFLLATGLLFLIARRLSGSLHVAFAASLIMLVNVVLLRSASLMMSEIPFMFFSLLCFYLFMITDFTKVIFRNWQFALVVVTLAISYYIRSSGLALFGGLLLVLAFRRQWVYLGGLAGGFVLLVLPWSLRNRAAGLGGNYRDQLLSVNPYRQELGQAGIGDFFNRFVANFERYLTREIPSATFNFIPDPNYQAEITTNEWTVGVLLLLPMFYGLYRLGMNFMLVFLYLLGTFGILLLWPDVWFGPRFLLPVVPLLTFLFVFGVAEALAWGYHKAFSTDNTAPAYIAVAALTLLGISTYSGDALEVMERRSKSPTPPAYQNFYALGDWVNANLPDTAVIASRKPVMFYLSAQRPTTRYKYTADTEEQLEHLRRRSVDYVVVEQLGYGQTGAYLVPAVQAYPNKFRVVHKLDNPDTYLIQFDPEG